MANINGTSSIDSLYGTDMDDIIIGFADNDYLQGGNGNDWLDGGAGMDTLYGDDGNDTLDGGSGYDFMYGGAGNDTYIMDHIWDGMVEDDHGPLGGVDTVLSSVSNSGLSEGIENLTLTGSAAVNGTGNMDANVIAGNIANNVLSGLDGNDTLTGGAGYDILYGETGNDNLNGGTDGDTLNGGEGNDYLYGGEGPLGELGDYISSDTLYGGNGNDILDGGSGEDFMYGGAGNDRYIEDHSWDVIHEDDTSLLGGVDTVWSSIDDSFTYGLDEGIENLILTGEADYGGGNTSNNVITGNARGNNLDGRGGNDTLYGRSGNDSLEGSYGNDTLNGEDGKDRLHGDDGNDRLNGGNGNDYLYGENGRDILAGGSGADVFKYASATDSLAGAGKDVISDFDGSAAFNRDQIDLRDVDANDTLVGDQAFTYIGSNAFSSSSGRFTPGQLRYSSLGVLQGNTDFDGAAEFEIQLTGGPAIFVNSASAGTDILL